MPTHLPPQTLVAESLAHARLVATDMDGTLTQTGKFTPRLLQTLESLQQADIPVVIVTGRSAGWVNAIVEYLPIAGAIAENGGIYFSAHQKEPEYLTEILDVAAHRRSLWHCFEQLQALVPGMQPATDNRFRLTDWTFDIHDLTPEQLERLASHCVEGGWGFTYSTVQCHIKPSSQNKGDAILKVIQQHFPDITPTQLVTIGDSPNDESLFSAKFPLSVGVANIHHYLDRLSDRPTYITQLSEVDGFCEVAMHLLTPLTS